MKSTSDEQTLREPVVVYCDSCDGTGGTRDVACPACGGFGLDLVRQVLIFVIYSHPEDYPEHFVVRPWIIAGARWWPVDAYKLAHSVDEARYQIRGMGLANLGRFEGDDPCIVESWM